MLLVYQRHTNENDNGSTLIEAEILQLQLFIYGNNVYFEINVNNCNNIDIISPKHLFKNYKINEPTELKSDTSVNVVR